MCRYLALTLLLITSSAPAQEAIGQPKANGPKLVYESWMAASFDDVRAGYVYDSVFEHDANGTKILRASRRLALTVRRFGDPAVMDAVTGTDETPEGNVVGTFMNQQISKQLVTNVRGVVKGEQLHVTAAGQMSFSKTVPWDPNVVGTWGELQLMGKKKPQPGASFNYMMFEPTVNALVTVQAKATAYETLEIGGKKVVLLRVDVQPLPVGGVTLPGSTFWYDATYKMIKSETIMPGMGKLVLERTTREDAMKPCQGPDLGMLQSIKLAQHLEAPHDASIITYRIKLTDKKPMEVFAQDERQTIKPIDGGIELTVRAVRQPPATLPVNAARPGPEFLQSNFFLTSDDPLVKQHAMTAVGKETDPWRQALLIERWVHLNMKALNFTDAMAPASEVARTKSGDCTEYSMLTAAMCRAAGIPSRTAIGWVYVAPRDARPAMLAMHMWTEIWVNGWVGLDATLGRGSVGPAHIKITDHSWDKVATMTPLLPLMRLNMASPSVEIVIEQRATQ